MYAFISFITDRRRRLLKATTAAAVGLVGLGATTSRATTLTFDDGLVTVGGTLAAQYSGLGATFAPGGGAITGVINPTSTTQGFATNTSMLVNVPGTTTTAPISGNVLHTQSGWLNEDGDPVFTMTLSSPVSFLSIDFGAVGVSAGQSTIFAVDPSSNTAVSVAVMPALANSTVVASGIPAGATTFVVLPGNYNDYVAVDNITYTLVPEPSTNCALLAGAGALGFALLRRRRATAWCQP